MSPRTLSGTLVVVVTFLLLDRAVHAVDLPLADAGWVVMLSLVGVAAAAGLIVPELFPPASRLSPPPGRSRPPGPG